jgi:hypothetical protein
VNDLDDLLDDIFDGKRPALYSEFAGWVQGSRRFSAFAARYRGKIRSKLKNARDEGGLQDLRAELQTAALLLRDKRFTLEYEKYAASKLGGPDFTVTFKTHIPFNVEVRRIRSVELADADADGRVGKVIAVLCDKVRQMPPSIVNLLWLHAELEMSEGDLTRAEMILRRLAERKADDFFTRRGFENAASFLKHYHHLSGIVLRQSSEQVLWLNALARHRAPREIVTAIQRLGTL